MNIDNWLDWHSEYDDPGSELAGRLKTVRRHVAAVVGSCPPGPVTVVSICGGQGREVIGALEDHHRRADVGGRLIEHDPDNATIARRWARRARLEQFEVVTGDASLSDAYDRLPPADLVVISGLFGHIDPPDQARTVDFLRQISRPGGWIVWTSSGRQRGGPNPLRRLFAERHFEEETFEQVPGDTYSLTVTLSRNRGSLVPFVRGEKVFSFGSSRQAIPPDAAGSVQD